MRRQLLSIVSWLSMLALLQQRLGSHQRVVENLPMSRLWFVEDSR
jgi:hypothetical protein